MITAEGRAFGIAATPLLDATDQVFVLVGVTSIDDSFLQQLVSATTATPALALTIANTSGPVASAGEQPKRATITDVLEQITADVPRISDLIDDHYIVTAPVLGANGSPAMTLVGSARPSSLGVTPDDILKTANRVMLVILATTIAAALLARPRDRTRRAVAPGAAGPFPR